MKKKRASRGTVERTRKKTKLEGCHVIHQGEQVHRPLHDALHQDIQNCHLGPLAAVLLHGGDPASSACVAQKPLLQANPTQTDRRARRKEEEERKTKEKRWVRHARASA